MRKLARVLFIDQEPKVPESTGRFLQSRGFAVSSLPLSLKNDAILKVIHGHFIGDQVIRERALVLNRSIMTSTPSPGMAAMNSSASFREPISEKHRLRRNGSKRRRTT